MESNPINRNPIPPTRSYYILPASNNKPSLEMNCINRYNFPFFCSLQFLRELQIGLLAAGLHQLRIPAGINSTRFDSIQTIPGVLHFARSDPMQSRSFHNRPWYVPFHPMRHNTTQHNTTQHNSPTTNLQPPVVGSSHSSPSSFFVSASPTTLYDTTLYDTTT